VYWFDSGVQLNRVVCRSLFVPVLAGLALLAAGCGGSKAPSVANLGPTTAPNTTPASYRQARTKWAACIRAHGVPNFPDPNSDGSVNLTGININSPQFLAAHQDCQSLVVASPPAVVKQQVKQELAVAQCMRKHGVPDFPDPNSQGKFPGGWPQSLTSTPLGAKAAKTCNPGTG
jgi:hypothetical protein